MIIIKSLELCRGSPPYYLVYKGETWIPNYYENGWQMVETLQIGWSCVKFDSLDKIELLNQCDLVPTTVFYLDNIQFMRLEPICDLITLCFVNRQCNNMSSKVKCLWLQLGLFESCIMSNPTNWYGMFFVQISIPTPSMHWKLIKHGKVCIW
jgi:hypothetical protein